MILCVTLNPCLDKTLVVSGWTPGESVRGRSVREVVGGKGNNVARALKALGHSDVRPTTFLGGAVGRRCEELLRESDGLDPIWISTASSSREILTVRTENSDAQTAFFDPDPAIVYSEAEELVRTVESLMSAGGVRGITMSGSSPSQATHSIYADLIALANARQIPSFLDTYGPSMEAIWGFWPTVLQMNLREASIALKLSKGRPTDQQIGSMLGGWSRKGVRIGLVTDGPNRFLARVENVTYRVAPPAIEPVNPIGSGDCSLAGLVTGLLAGLNPVESLKTAVGCAVANALVWDAGAIDPTVARQISDEVIVEQIE